MRDIEELLGKNKKHFDELEAPEDMETRLINALSKRKGKNLQWKKLAIVASLIIVLIFTYNYNALAYYGKRLLGYDSVMSQTLQDLNELGKGQEIGKSLTFDNGVKITLDGIMADDNQLLAFYRIMDPNAEKEDISFHISPISIRGLFKEYYPSWGEGEFNEKTKELKMVHSFDPPSFYEKNLKFQGHFGADGQYEEFIIDFTLDRNKAMGHSIKQDINKKITIENQDIYLKNILATNTQTVIKGSMASLLDLVQEQVLGEQVRPHIGINLIANGEVLEPLGSGLRTNLKEITFDHRFDTLPKDLKDLKIQIDHLTIDKKLDEVIPIQSGEKKRIEVEGQEISIIKVQSFDTIKTPKRTEITIESEESLFLYDIELIADGESIPLEATHSEKFRKTNDGIFRKRIVVFNGFGEDLKLKLNRIHYEKEYNKIIDIPIK